MSVTATGGHERGIEARRRGPRIPARLLRLASDERLVDALRGGSEVAFEVIYTRYHRGVLSFCRHMLGSVEEAEDAVQHTFIAAYRDLLRSRKPIRLRPWLYTIARNRCLSVLRARREQLPDEPAEPSTEYLSSEVERRHDLRALLGDLAALAPNQRAALVLAELGDMSHDEIGAVLGCPKEKVKALVFQARSSLIASRTARETSCAEIREQLANLRGGSLRRNTLRRHLRECPGCREYRDQAVALRRELALILPVAPTLGLKATVLGAAGVTAAAGGGSASAVATAVVALCVAGGGTAAVDIARDDEPKRPAPGEARPARVVPAVAPPGADEAKQPAAGVGETPGNGANPTAARPPRAKGPKPTAARPVRARAEKVRGPKPKADKTHGPKPKSNDPRGPKPEPVTARGPKPRVVKVRAPKPPAGEAQPRVVRVRAPQPKADKAPKPKAEKPAEPAPSDATVKPGKSSGE
jgi:RNA polymerase sigma factor (sigma-70 family)